MFDSKEVLLPESCCVCQGQVDTTVKFSKEHKQDELIKTQSLNVPICYSCDEKLDKKAKILITVFTLAGFLLHPIIFYFWGGESQSESSWTIKIISLATDIIPMLIGGAIGFGFGTFFAGFFEPVSLKADGEIIFRNKKYQEDFIELNENKKDEL